jgi:hypothetical protein
MGVPSSSALLCVVPNMTYHDVAALRLQVGFTLHQKSFRAAEIVIATGAAHVVVQNGTRCEL